MTHSHRLALRAWLSLAALSWHLVPSALALTPITTLPESLLHLLNETVNGRLYEGIPLALPCFQRYGNAAVLPNEAECNAIEAGYTTSTFRASAFGAFMEVSRVFSVNRDMHMELGFFLEPIVVGVGDMSSDTTTVLVGFI